MEPLHGSWNEIVDRVQPHLVLLPPGGEIAMRVVVDESVWDRFCYCFSLENGQLTLSALRWYRAHDRERWRSGAGIVPDIRRIEKQLTAQEADYFPAFFDQLATENVHLLLEESPGWTLDGSETVIELFRNSQLVRKFDWPAGMQSRGPMKQLEKLIDRSRTYFPNE